MVTLWPHPAAGGGLLVAWGFFLLVRLVQLGRMEPASGQEPAARRATLASSILTQLRQATWGRKEGNLTFVAHPALLALFLLGSLYAVLLVAAIWRNGAIDTAAASGPAGFVLCAIAFWLAQGYALERRQATVLMALCGAASLLCVALIAAKGGAVESSLMLRFASVGAAGVCALYALAGLCLFVFGQGVVRRRRGRWFPAAGVAFLSLMVLADYSFGPSPALQGFWLCSWAFLGAAWSQAWPRSKRHYFIFQSA